ncbi:MAG: hypothetical protein KJZ87_05030, partial [Thermoguttaceae bacterium]|nr:hypothetical protein [Thermoguttaceae bacterium]
GALCLYDNAGESFLPGQDTASNPVTRHLARSGAIFFTFDPTQDVRFRRACAGHTADIQMMERTERSQRENSVRQETILVEAAQRVRRYAGLSHAAKHHRPLIVIVTKYDAWAPLLGPGSLPRFWHANSSGTLCAVRHDMIEGVSRKLRELLRCLSPEIVAAAEGFASEVIYVPVSATGCGPELAPGMKTPGFRPRNIRPLWAEVPMIYTMSRWMSGFVYFVGPSPGQSTAAAAPPALPGGNGAAATQRSPSRVFGATLNGDSV